MADPDRLILASDLDGTLADGSAAARAELLRLLAAHPAASTLYVTGRTVASARALCRRAALPAPAVLIADVGTRVVHGLGPDPVEPIEREIVARWPGVGPVQERLDRITALSAQVIDTPHRASYWIEPVRRMRGAANDEFAARGAGDASLGEAAERIAAEVGAEVEAALAGLGVDVLVSANVFLDVLPRGVNKGWTLRRVLDWLGADGGACVVAGDSLNDLALFETGHAGIAVGNCEPALRRAVETLGHVYLAEAHGAEGVLEGLRHYGRLGEGAEVVHGE